MVDATAPQLPGLDAMPYSPARDIFDEMMTPDLTLRPHWKPLVAGLQALGHEELSHRWERGRRMVRDNGVSYNVYGTPDGRDRAWQLDPIPLVVPAPEWRALEEALVQRAVLFDLILRDLYGPQRLLTGGLLPLPLVLANPAFLLPLHGAPTEGPMLHFYGADLARSPDGRWWVVGDRSEAPSGAGYALENRIIVSRMIPELFRSNRVERLTEWFAKVRQGLVERASWMHDTPRIVLLTPGPYNETWFEQAYLARHLGLTLVEGEDLTSRDGRIHLKTAEGLKPVDVILRRTDGAFCDPLELRSDSRLGVPGLVQAVHSGSVTVANALGSGLVESPVFMAFLPSLCKALLGEDLRLPSVATWWCGQLDECEHVITNLDSLALRPAFSVSAPAVRGIDMSAADKKIWADRLRSEGWRWVAQEAVNLSTAPVWTDAPPGGRIEPRPVVLRAHACAVGGTYAVMPGGLTRTASAPREQSVSMQLGGGSKDTWVVGEATDAPPVATATIAPSPVNTARRGINDLSSRVADNMFWLGRYLERCEDLCRMLKAAIDRHMEGPELADELNVAMSIFYRLSHLPEGYDLSTPERREGALRSLVNDSFNPEHPNGVAGLIQAIQRVTMVARDRLSLDTWKAITHLSKRIQDVPPPGDLEHAGRTFGSLIASLLAVSGLAQESMTRGLGWRFMDLGRRIERALRGLDLLESAACSEPDDLDAMLDLILDVLDSRMTYRSRYLSVTNFEPALDLVLADETNPRSIAFQIARLLEHVDLLAPESAHRHRVFTPEQRLVISMQASVRTLAVDRVQQAPGNGLWLGTLTETLRDDLTNLTNALTRHHFVHAAEVRHTHVLPVEPMPDGTPEVTP